MRQDRGRDRRDVLGSKSRLVCNAGDVVRVSGVRSDDAGDYKSVRNLNPDNDGCPLTMTAVP